MRATANRPKAKKEFVDGAEVRLGYVWFGIKRFSEKENTMLRFDGDRVLNNSGVKTFSGSWNDF